MGISAFLILAALEIALAARTCRRRPDRGIWRRDRLAVRGAECALAALHLILAPAQKWRFVPALGLLAALLALSALVLLVRRGQREGTKKAAGAVASCAVSVLALGLSLIPAFLFTGYHGLPVTGPYRVEESAAILIDHARTDPFETDGSAREVPVHFYYPEEAGRFPLVLFSHGAFGYYQSNTSTYLELASNGYVVAALDHPHHAFFTQDSEGGTVLVDSGFLSTALDISNSEDAFDAEERLAIYRDWMALRTADMNFVLDALEAAARTGAVAENWVISADEAGAVQSALERMDCAQIGLMGHSMGGAAAVALGRERGDISAVIDIDGTMLGEYLGVENGALVLNETPYPVPVLEFNNWSSYLSRAAYLEQGGRYPNEELIRHADAGFTTTIRDTEHMDFTDLPLFSPFLGGMLGSGTRDTAETMTLVNSLVLSFFDAHLKGEGAFTVQELY